MKDLPSQQWVVIFAALLLLLVSSPFFPLVNCAEVPRGGDAEGGNFTNLWLPPPTPKSAKMDTCEIARSWGYECISYDVPLCGTGYTVKVFRILPKNVGDEKKVVYLQHGLMSSSSDWVSARPNNLACYLSDHGYDVWLGNIRGNTYGCKHSSMDISNKQFWDFKLKDCSLDLYCILNFMLDTTGASQFSYAGHSMGCAMFFILAHYYPAFVNAKCTHMVALAPAVYVNHATCPLANLAVVPTFMRQELSKLMTSNGAVWDMANKYLHDNADIFCVFCPMSWCQTLMAFFTGSDCSHYSNEEMTRIMAHSPSSSCPYLVDNYMSWISSGSFCEHDYGWWTNLDKYGSFTPPSYDLTRYKRDVFILSGGMDRMTAPKDCTRLADELKKSATVKEACISKYNHVDFIFGKDAEHECYSLILDYLEINS